MSLTQTKAQPSQRLIIHPFLSGAPLPGLSFFFFWAVFYKNLETQQAQAKRVHLAEHGDGGYGCGKSISAWSQLFIYKGFNIDYIIIKLLVSKRVVSIVGTGKKKRTFWIFDLGLQNLSVSYLPPGNNCVVAEIFFFFVETLGLLYSVIRM